MIKIIAKMLVKKDMTEDFKLAVRELVEKSAAEEGNVFYTLNASKENPCLFAIIECWKDQAAIDYHNNTEHFTTILPKLGEMCEGDTSIELFDEVALF